MTRVVRPGGVVAACLWDFADGMQMLRVFWQAARAASPEVAGETVGSREDLDELFRASGLGEVGTMALDVATDYEDFDELWSTFLLGVGPSG
jgi:hypothetical protein